MGFGDPYHKHPLRWIDTGHPVSANFYMGHPLPIDDPPLSTNCFHCEFPVKGNKCFGCKDCDYYIHMICQNLPINLRVPLHDEHLLTLFQSPSNSSSSSSNSPIFLCNECQCPCVGRFAYQCTICQFFFHLKCLFTLKLEKHQHPLIFADSALVDPIYARFKNCKICGSYIWGFCFNCSSCNFYIHQECSFIPLEIKHHHVHKLTLRHNFPEECDQVYCDLCEDRDGEMDRELSHYYCKDCDYIAHVKCCNAQPSEDVFFLCERFTHEHPWSNQTHLLSCMQRSYTFGNYAREYPSLVKHPRHPQHTLLFVSGATDNFNCTECNFSMDEKEFVKFAHPLWKDSLKFICKNSMFRCDACGELGKGSRIGSGVEDESEFEFDLHLECFALPGKLEHESHPDHPLYLRWLGESRFWCCSICRKEMDPQLWFYFCQECDSAAHMDCIARDLLSTLRSAIKNQPAFCAIIAPDASSFKYRIADMRPPPLRSFFYNDTNAFTPTLEVDFGDLGIQTDGYELSCPKCNSLIATQAGYSTIRGWKSSFRENSIIFANDQTPSESDSLSFLDEQMIDELCCSICNLSIFPPTYSCATCKIFFHKSCAELPPKIIYNETTYILKAPPFPEGLSNCTFCKSPICNWAYLSEVKGFVFDVQCATGAPLVNSTHDNQLRFSRHIYDRMCAACGNLLEKGTFLMMTNSYHFFLHPECGLLPSVIKHRIHQHPLQLATNLAVFDCEYFCDVCEKYLNPDIWAYRCMDICGIWATSHVSCVITSKKKCHFSYGLECQTWTEEKKLKFRRKAKGEEVSESESE